jgi:hypothetical protein
MVFTDSVYRKIREPLNQKRFGVVDVRVVPLVSAKLLSGQVLFVLLVQLALLFEQVVVAAQVFAG